jgi:hypothetical protein
MWILLMVKIRVVDKSSLWSMKKTVFAGSTVALAQVLLVAVFGHSFAIDLLPITILSVLSVRRWKTWRSPLVLGLAYGGIVLSWMILARYVITDPWARWFEEWILGPDFFWIYGAGPIVPVYTLIPLVSFAVFRVLSGRVVVQDGTLCAQCGYCLIGNVSGVCPECGWPIAGWSGGEAGSGYPITPPSASSSEVTTMK